MWQQVEELNNSRRGRMVAEAGGAGQAEASVTCFILALPAHIDFLSASLWAARSQRGRDF